MTAFQEELVKILFDKLLLGLLAGAFGFYLSRLLEDHRARNARRLSVVQQRIEASRALVEIVSQHHDKVLGLLEMIYRVAEKQRRGEKATEEDEKAGLAYIENTERLASRVTRVIPLVTYEMAEALIAYMTDSKVVSDILKGIAPFSLPTRESLDESYLRFVFSYQAALLNDDLVPNHGKDAARAPPNPPIQPTGSAGG